jgi:hypothetical protein
MRTCLFCEQGVSSKEDAWPIWLMNRFPVPKTARMFAERGGRQLPSWQLAEPRLIVRWLCRACNNGWMSDLEGETKPIVESILDEKLNAIDASAQTTLAHWAVKTAMVLEAFGPYPEQWFYTALEREQMRQTRAIPRHTSVWIAKCVNQPNIGSEAKNLLTGAQDDGVRGIAVSMAFGSLALQVVTVKIPAVLSESSTVTYEVSKEPWDDALVRVWPTSLEAKAWPPAYGLDGDHGLHALTERFSPAMT